MSEPRILDHTALIALFDGSSRAFDLWEKADQDLLTLILPTAAVAEANHVLGGTIDTWRAVLDPPRVIVTPLDLSTAIDSAPQSGTLAVRHVIHEARQVRGAIITRAPWQYPTDGPPVRTV